MRRLILPLAVALLLAGLGVPGAATVRSVFNRLAPVRGSSEVILRATAESPYLPCCDCPYGWWVQVTEVIHGPLVVGRLLVVLEATIAGPCWPGGTIDPHIAPGDEVEASGVLVVDPSLGLSVSLCGSDGYYLRRVTPAPTSTTTPTATLAHRALLPKVLVRVSLVRPTATPTGTRTPVATSTPTPTGTLTRTPTPRPTAAPPLAIAEGTLTGVDVSVCQAGETHVLPESGVFLYSDWVDLDAYVGCYVRVWGWTVLSPECDVIHVTAMQIVDAPARAMTGR